ASSAGRAEVAEVRGPGPHLRDREHALARARAEREQRLLPPSRRDGLLAHGDLPELRADGTAERDDRRGAVRVRALGLDRDLPDLRAGPAVPGADPHLERADPGGAQPARALAAKASQNGSELAITARQ